MSQHICFNFIQNGLSFISHHTSNHLKHKSSVHVPSDCEKHYCKRMAPAGQMHATKNTTAP